jgi:hypothetical protein
MRLQPQREQQQGLVLVQQRERLQEQEPLPSCHMRRGRRLRSQLPIRATCSFVEYLRELDEKFSENIATS